MPTFMKGRIFIDFSSEEKLAENFEALLRNIFDKPLYQEPALGKPPSFLLENERISPRPGYKLKMLKDAVLKGRPTVAGLVTDYLTTFENALADFRFTKDDYEVRFGEKVLSSTVLANRYGSVFNIFARAESRRHFETLKTVLGVANKEELLEKLDSTITHQGFGYALRSENVGRMMNLDRLDTRP